MVVVGSTRRIRFEVAGPGGTVLLRGDLEGGFESQLNLLREHAIDTKIGIAGRFHVEAADASDKPGYVEWGNGGPTLWIYPNRRGPRMDWARFPTSELLDDFVAIWESHQPEALEVPLPIAFATFGFDGPRATVSSGRLAGDDQTAPFRHRQRCPNPVGDTDREMMGPQVALDRDIVG